MQGSFQIGSCIGCVTAGIAEAADLLRLTLFHRCFPQRNFAEGRQSIDLMNGFHKMLGGAIGVFITDG